MSKIHSGKPPIVDNFVAPACQDVVKILHQDQDFLFIDKPSGLLSLSGKNPLNWDSVHHRLRNGQDGVTAIFPDATLPHRLDLGTSGVMAVGLHAAFSKHLNQQFQNRQTTKEYIAMLDGWVADNHGSIDAAIAKDTLLFPRVKICEKTGKSAITEYTVLRRLVSPRRTLVLFKPITGRTHQLRIHSLYFGHPILGCDLYHNQHSQQNADRLMLHASKLSFYHPTKATLIHGQSPCSFL